MTLNINNVERYFNNLISKMLIKLCIFFLLIIYLDEIKIYKYVDNPLWVIPHHITYPQFNVYINISECCLLYCYQNIYEYIKTLII